MDNLYLVFRPSYSKEIHRPKHEAHAKLAFEREDHLFVTIAPHAILTFDLEGSEVRRTGTEEYTGLDILDCHL